MSSEKTLQKFLNELKTNSGITTALLVTEDGLLIAVDELNNNSEKMSCIMEIGAVSAGILSMAEKIIELVTDQSLSQIVIKAGRDDVDPSVTCIITLVYKNVILLIFLPSTLNIGLVFYEIENTKQKISQFLQEKDDNFILHPESVL